MLKSQLVLKSSQSYRVVSLCKYFFSSSPRGQEFDDYLTLVLELVLCFGGTGFYHVRFNSNTAA